jgi:hypothetical protein
MLALTSARAAFLLYQNARAVTGAADHLSRYIVPLLREWSAFDAELASLLETLGARGDALLEPIEFLMQWTGDKGSSCSTTVFQAREALQRIEIFLEKTSRRKGAMKEEEKEALVKQLKRFLRELDFLVASLNLAVAVATASEAHHPKLPQNAYITSSSSSSSSSPLSTQALPAEPARYISPSCLLRASERMKSMGVGMSGDLAVAFGSFYSQRSVNAGSFEKALQRAMDSAPAAPAQPAPTARWLTPMSTVTDVHASNPANSSGQQAEWNVSESHFTPAFAAVVSEEPSGPVARWSEDGGEMKSAEEPTDDWSQISPNIRPSRSSNTVPAAAAFGAAATASYLPPLPRAAAVAAPAGPNVMGPWRQVYASACMKLVRNGKRNCYELHVTNLQSSVDGISRPSASTLKFDLTASLDFRSTSSRHLDLHEDAASKLRGSALVDAVFSFQEQIANVTQERFAFMLHSVDEQPIVEPTGFTSTSLSAAAAVASAGDTLRPLDIAYLARLCMYENEFSPTHPSSVANGMARSTSRNHLGADGPSLRHTQATDEELWLLLAGVHIYPETDASKSGEVLKASTQ